MKGKGLPVLIVGIVSFIAGLLLLERGGVGILLMLAGIGCMIFGSVLLMHLSGSVKDNYFENGQHHCSDQPSAKHPSEQE